MGRKWGPGEWKVRILKKPGCGGWVGGEGAWAGERWESGAGGRRGGEGGRGVDSPGHPGTLWTAKTVGKWCPVWGGLEDPV